MRTEPSNMPVADYCNAMNAGIIRVNRDYQRSDKVWPPAARSYLIETILLNFPIPKFSLHQVTDLRSKKSVKEIVDGQQRSQAMLDFFNNRLRLSRTLELSGAAGQTYEELDEELQQRFLSYSLTLDLFMAAQVDEVREVFRRINSYTIPLNDEEERHATYQGPFKWFIHALTRRFDRAFLLMDVFGEKQLIRMQDAKLLTEIVHALVNGIETTNKRKLDALYRSHDREDSFPEADDLTALIDDAIGLLVQWEDLHDTVLMRAHIFYALCLAVIHATNPVDELNDVYQVDRRRQMRDDHALANLSALAVAVDEKDVEGPYGEFVRASLTRTNVASQRSERLAWCCRALLNDGF
jgi:hypothetical protein